MNARDDSITTGGRGTTCGVALAAKVSTDDVTA
jgi:hypothetical protein